MDKDNKIINKNLHRKRKFIGFFVDQLLKT